MDKKEMLRAIIAHYAGGKKALFAQMIGVRPQTLTTWETRHTFDAELLHAKCKDLSGDWLLSGEGNMLKLPPKPEPIIPLVNIGNIEELRTMLCEVAEKYLTK